jgi:hypothetical protein
VSAFMLLRLRRLPSHKVHNVSFPCALSCSSACPHFPRNTHAQSKDVAVYSSSRATLSSSQSLPNLKKNVRFFCRCRARHPTRVGRPPNTTGVGLWTTRPVAAHVSFASRTGEDPCVAKSNVKLVPYLHVVNCCLEPALEAALRVPDFSGSIFACNQACMT